MTLTITNLKDSWVSIVENIDCGNLTLAEQEEIYHLYSKRKILVFKNQKLTNQQLKSFASIFGNVWDNSVDKFSGLTQTNKFSHENDFVELVSESGIARQNKLYWHVDLTHFPTQLIPNRLLYAVDIGGPTAATKFIDTIQGLQLIDPKIRKFLTTATVLCKAPYQTPWEYPTRRPALGWHPAHNNYGLIIDLLFTECIIGLPEDTDYRQWIEENVILPMQSSETCYDHYWELNDLVLYDNWSTIHSRDAFEGIRRLKRITWDQDWNKYKCL